MVNILTKLLSTQPKVGNTTFIAIDGHGGSGKSTLAKILSEKLGAEIVHTDDFASWDNPLNWHLNVIEEIFEPIASGVTKLNYQPTSWWENHHPEAVVDQPVTDIMILEGVSSSRSEFDSYISFRIFVDTPREVCLERGIERDSGTGKSKEELTAMWEGWFLEEDKYIKQEDPKSKADLVLDGTVFFDKQVTFDL